MEADLVMRVDELSEGFIILNRPLAPLYIEEIGDSSAGNLILRCAYTPGTFPGISLILAPDSLLTVSKPPQ